MITARAWAGKHYAVYGLARSGLATVQALLASGAQVTAWDERDEARGRAHGAELLDLDTADLTQFDSLILSPGVPLNIHPLAARAREAGIEIIGDIELFARARPELPPHKVVGITGTNGKSTTTALVHHILATAGVPATMGGNIGLPLLAQDPLPEGGVYVLELSSFQIDLTQSLDCDVAVLLNITPDHLDRYESFEAYAASKARLFEMQSALHVAFVGESTAEIIDQVTNGLPQRVMSIHGECYVDSFGNTEMGLSGVHNGENVGVAAWVCEELGLTTESVWQAGKTFRGLPHRMERVREKDGVLFVNDSKATNPEAAAPALAAYSDKRWIASGQAKTEDLRDTAPAVASYPRVRWIVGGQAKTDTLGDTAKHLDLVVHAYTIGEAGPLFARLLREAGTAVTECGTLENAVKRAAADSQPGEVVLLSPACASFDQFRDFEARGEAFRRAVGEL
ncbi:UDP-N-acetylmuramoyl-L-alanine--D-glutamate ligase [uncultured Sphingomonas sp.]|uniref:UDP-N-acetylmuramoyl-L-alanine--D-glutamate ligase n=1 Tax=uncultured Sphingomonas sp. TaxID=158754 RepID=UPI0025D7FD71|nr:UDP-N-acetylmuramoyl-L-alanine--D-glutamate ligase [uncultured Sphingomonas sp.]